MIDLYREPATDARTAHRISELDRALSLIRGVISSQYRFLDSHASGDLATVAGILLVERALLQRPTPQSADHAAEETEGVHYNCQECGAKLGNPGSMVLGLCRTCRESHVNN